MDHRQKMVVVPQQSKIKVEDDDDEDVEALRLAALKSLRTKDATHKRSALSQVQKVSSPQLTQSSRFTYKNQRPTIKKNYYRIQQRQNGVSFYFICYLQLIIIAISHGIQKETLYVYFI
ncbi:hypothetical protein PUN28_012001 [Cardiocondyla obscurior]|uniref:Uncharacterized protein n=1 Tax=Cardiocondyla obscurior TaxID=286306 RepID=A0AAW2FA46_9HYME